jgi:hypothetical protein
VINAWQSHDVFMRQSRTSKFPCWFMDVEGAEFPLPGLCEHAKPLRDHLVEDVKNLLNPPQAEHQKHPQWSLNRPVPMVKLIEKNAAFQIVISNQFPAVQSLQCFICSKFHIRQCLRQCICRPRGLSSSFMSSRQIWISFSSVTRQD